MRLEKIYSRLSDEIRESVDGTKRYYVIAATLDKHNNIIATAQNSYVKTHPMEKRLAIKAGRPCREYLHAEIGALVKSCTKAESIMVVRSTRRGLTKCAKPCDICMMALKEAGVKRIYFSDDSGTLKEEEV
jgi:Cytidine and deoxycytidylate deaminase zinc-binding region.